jgi:hypothetical protein
MHHEFEVLSEFEILSIRLNRILKRYVETQFHDEKVELAKLAKEVLCEARELRKRNEESQQRSRKL